MCNRGEDALSGQSRDVTALTVFSDGSHCEHAAREAPGWAPGQPFARPAMTGYRDVVRVLGPSCVRVIEKRVLPGGDSCRICVCAQLDKRQWKPREEERG
jgi:hypothetical protein